MEKRIITCALTGAMSPKALNHNVPVTPEEIAEDAYKCWKAGASIVHLHMRDEHDKPSNDIELFRESLRLIKERCDIICNITSTGAVNGDYDIRTAYVDELKPEMFSLDVGSLNWLSGNPPFIMAHPPLFVEELCNIALKNGSKPEIEIFNTGDFSIVEDYVKRGLLKGPLHFSFIMGVKGGTSATVANLNHFKSLMPAGSTFSAMGVSKGCLPMLYASLAMGGHVRVGLEDTNWYSKGVMATNEMLVARAARLIREMNCEVATPDEAREILAMKHI